MFKCSSTYMRNQAGITRDVVPGTQELWSPCFWVVWIALVQPLGARGWVFTKERVVVDPLVIEDVHLPVDGIEQPLLVGIL